MKAENLFQAQNGKCFHCNQEMGQYPGNKWCNNGWTKDHVYPQAHGGKGGKNIVLACWDCNQLKADRLPTGEMILRAKAIWKCASKFAKADSR